jgi:precorrin-3B synthase
LIDLSARANVQLRGVTEVSHPALVEGLRQLGLVDANPEAEARRNITVQPFWVPGDATEAVARALEAMSIEPEAPDLPGKFGVAVDCGPAPLLRAVSADIRVERAFGGLVVAADGMQTGAPVTVDEAPQAVAALMHWFLQAGGSVAGRGRMRGLVARAARPPARFATCALQGTAAPPPVPGLVAQGALVGVEFGQMQAATLAALAALGPLRVTPWRMLLIEGAQALPNLPGLITDPEDPLRPVVACTGAPGCLQGKAPVRELARKLAPHWRGGTLHLSGCAKGCAHPGPAETVLVATGAGFDLVLGGQASDVPVWRGLSAADLETNPELLHGRP